MADTIFKGWEDRINDLNTQNVINGLLEDIRKLKEEVYNLQIDRYTRPLGKVIHDDKRIVLSAPEIIIGNVNMGGMLDPAGGSTVIIRGNNVAVQGVGDLGKVDVQAPIIQQKAENPGIDGNEHVVGAVSKLVSQAENITLQSDAVDEGGALLPLHEMTTGGILLQAEHEVQVKACQYQDREDQMKARKEALAAELKACEQDVEREKAAYQQAQKAFDELLKKRDALDDQENAIRTNYMDRDELNQRMDDLSMVLSKNLYAYADAIARRGEAARLKQFFEDQETAAGKKDAEKFKKEPIHTGISISGEVINLKSEDGNGAIRTNPEAGVNIRTNAMSIAGILDEKGKLLEGNKLDVNMKRVEITTAGAADQKSDDQGILQSAQYAAEGDVIVRSKNITLESMDYEVADKKYKEKSLTEDGKIKIRSKSIEMSTENSSDVDVDEKGQITQATYTAEGSVTVNSKTFAVTANDTELKGDDLQEKALTKGGSISLRAENVGVSATDKEDKATGEIVINAQKLNLKGETTVSEAEKELYIYGGEYVEVNSEDKALFYGKTIAELKQGDSSGKAVVQLKGGNAKVSGANTTLHGETTVKVLKAPEIESDNLHVNQYIKVSNVLEGGMEISKKDTSTDAGELEPKHQKSSQGESESTE